MDEDHEATKWSMWIMAGAGVLAAGIAAAFAISCYRRRPQQRARRLVDRSRRLIDTISEALEEFEQATAETEG